MSDEPAPRESWESPLDEAVRAVLATPLGDDAVDRVQRRALRLQSPSDVPRRQRRKAHRRGFVPYLAGGVAALVLVAVALLMSPHDAWAQVADALRGKTWVRMTLKVPPGVEIPGDGRPPETWFSLKQRRCARRFAGAAGFIDFAKQETWDYDPEQKTIRLASTIERENDEFGMVGLLFALVLPDKEVPTLPGTKAVIEKQERREVVENGRRWIEFVFDLRDPGRYRPELQITFRVDPETNLPIEVRDTTKVGPTDTARERTYILDYPEAGPADIYALGVPRSAQVIDRRRKVTETAELKELFAAYNQAWKVPIEPFKATVLQMTLNRRDVHFAYRVKHSDEGTQGWVVDLDQLLAIRNDVWAKKLTVPKDAESWWLERVAALPSREQYLDQMLTPHEVNYPKMTGGIFGSTEFYTPNLDSHGVSVSLDKQPEIGPPGTVLLRVLVESPGGTGFNDAAYWIAPDRGYQVVRSELRHKKQREPWDIRVTVVDEMAQSPGGRWYARQTRLGYVEHSGDELPEQAGEGGVSTSLYRYYLEFE